MISITIITIKISFMCNIITKIIIYHYNCIMLDIIVHNINIQWHISIYQLYIQHIGGGLSPCSTITAYNTTSSGNIAIWARRTKCHSPSFLYYYENKKILLNYVMHMWAVSRDSPLLHGDLENVKLLFYEYLSVLIYKYMFQIIAK